MSAKMERRPKSMMPKHGKEKMPSSTMIAMIGLGLVKNRASEKKWNRMDKDLITLY